MSKRMMKVFTSFLLAFALLLPMSVTAYASGTLDNGRKINGGPVQILDRSNQIGGHFARTNVVASNLSVGTNRIIYVDHSIMSFHGEYTIRGSDGSTITGNFNLMGRITWQATARVTYTVTFHVGNTSGATRNFTWTAFS